MERFFNFGKKKEAILPKEEAPMNPGRRGFVLGGLAAIGTASLGSESDAAAKKKALKRKHVVPHMRKVQKDPIQTEPERVWTVRETRRLVDTATQTDKAFRELVDPGVHTLGWVLDDFSDETLDDPEHVSLRERFPNYPEMLELFPILLAYKNAFTEDGQGFMKFIDTQEWNEADKTAAHMQELLHGAQELLRDIMLIPGMEEYCAEKRNQSEDSIVHTGAA